MVTHHGYVAKKTNKNKREIVSVVRHNDWIVLFHLGLEVYPVLVSLLVVERQPGVRHIVHQVVPVPHGHPGLLSLMQRKH